MIYCVFIGSFKDRRFKQLTQEFHQRLSRLWPVKILELAEKEKEILKFIQEKSGKVLLISLEPHGKSMDSASFGDWVTKSSKDIYFFAWGADGPPKGFSKNDFTSVSLSPMTYSHEMARMLLMEQLYRAGAELRGHPYPH
jgi:23S rRNA (pseudouridine1915-N3)-methyltransferase